MVEGQRVGVESRWFSAAGSPTSRSDRWSAIAFGIVMAAAVPLLLYQGRDQWFFFDEWTILAGRDLSVDGLLQPHNEHLIALPVLSYRLLFRFVGLQAYWPYQAVVIGAHLMTTMLLWTVMRRTGVRSWIATATASAFVVFGSGRQDIMWAFQISFTGALALGLAQLLLADHSQVVGRRDALGVACGILAVLCSTIGVIMVGVVGLAVVLRRGWGAAALQIGPPAALWLTWWWNRGRGSYGESSGISGGFDYVTKGFGHTLAQTGRFWGSGAVLGVVLLVGVLLGLRSTGVATYARQNALALSLLLGGLGFLAVTGVARGGRTGNDVPEATRYVYLTGAMLFPTLALAIDRLADHYRLAALGAVAVLAIGVPGNIDSLHAHGFEQLTLGRKEVVLVGASLPELREVPADRTPFSFLEGPVTATWLRSAVAHGKVPDPPSVSESQRASVALEMSLRPMPIAPGLKGCVPLTGAIPVSLDRGDSLAFVRGPLQVQLRRAGATSDALVFAADGRQSLVAVAGTVDLVVAPVNGAIVDLCAAKSP